MAVTKALAKVAKNVAQNADNVLLIIECAGAVVAAASFLAEQAQPLVENIDLGEALNAPKEAANKVAGFFGKLGDAKDDFIGGLAEAKSEKDLRKAIKEARQVVLENANASITISDLLKAQEKSDGLDVGPISTMPGCFVIATYRKLDFDKDLTDYIGLYYGKADNVSEAIAKAISREGDPDVYADVKYKQNVHVYVYYSLPDEMDALYESLSQTFGE